MCQPGSHLRATHFGGMDGVGDHHHRAAFAQEAFQLLGPPHRARVGELPLDAVQFRKPGMVAGTGDREHDEGPPPRGGAQGVHGDPVAGAREGFVVRGEIVPVRELPLGAGGEAEVVGGGGHLARGRGGDAGEKCQSDGQC